MDLKNILQASENIKNQMNSLLPDISKEITTIIESDDKSVQRIEELLDTLVNFGQMSIGKSDFVRLNSYYATFNAEYADAYTAIYKSVNEV
mgnify:CR=1 FL=1|jgi:hypothetical protein